MSETDLLEVLADLEHRQWMSWTGSLVMHERLPASLIKRWEQNWKPYGDLPEEAKEQDRIQARKVLDVLRQHGVEVCDG